MVLEELFCILYTEIKLTCEYCGMDDQIPDYSVNHPLGKHLTRVSFVLKRNICRHPPSYPGFEHELSN